MLLYNILYFVRKYFLKLNNVSQTSNKRFVETLPILSLLISELCFFLCLKLYSLNFNIARAQKRSLCLSEFVMILVVH